MGGPPTTSERNYLLGLARKRPGHVNWGMSDEAKVIVDEQMKVEEARIREEYGDDYWKAHQLEVRNRVRRDCFRDLEPEEKKRWNVEDGLPDMSKPENRFVFLLANLR